MQNAADPAYKKFEGIAAKAGVDGKATLAEFMVLYESLAKK